MWSSRLWTKQSSQRQVRQCVCGGVFMCVSVCVCARVWRMFACGYAPSSVTALGAVVYGCGFACLS